ncbi:MAG: 4-(cytidine 5'-diphospho)-2-C-methyl-D-erythritol kinase, partial [Bacillota bacterium]|nr:4-(cytidine 5'-diphospho)-2-C-methyl-D-erythritol kinase [Bacillota bacterium]
MLISENAHAKINLTLDILGKRPDGYHELRTVYQSLALCDTLRFLPSPDGSITLGCDVPGIPLSDDNLAIRAARMLGSHYGVTKGVHIELVKRIPMAAGLAGGSSDAAAALRGLVRFWQLPHEKDVLNALAARLGSDVPFCLAGGTAIGTGRGEQVTALPSCPHFYVVLSNPGFAESTAEV